MCVYIIWKKVPYFQSLKISLDFRGRCTVLDVVTQTLHRLDKIKQQIVEMRARIQI